MALFWPVMNVVHVQMNMGSVLELPIWAIEYQALLDIATCTMGKTSLRLQRG